MSAFPSAACRTLLWGVALVQLNGCTDSFAPDVVKTPPTYLVVDGFINAQGVTTIKLSRTYAIASGAAAPPVEARATVYLEEENGPRYLLREAPLGTYATTTALNLNPGKKYRLHLNTVGGQEYASDFLAAKTTPPIDNLTWRVDGQGLNVYVNAHDASSITRYYRWDYDETWEIRPPYSPTVEYVSPAIRFIRVPYPTICWGTARSTTALLDKTTALKEDVVTDFRVRLLERSSDRLFTRYSILVQQQALTKEEYAYWELLKKNTESIGTLFDPQPAQLTGNVRCLSNPDELALGFVSVHTVSEKRLFIDHADLPSNWPVVSGYEKCIPPDTVYIDRRNCPCKPDPNPPVEFILSAAFNNTNRLPIDRVIAKDSLYGPVGGVAGYTLQTRDCVDCRTRGTSIRPSYW